MFKRIFKLKERYYGRNKNCIFLGGDKVRRGVLTTLTASFILLFSSFTFSSCKSCDKEDKGREPIGGDGNANDKPSDTSTLGGSSKISTSSGTTGDNGSGGGATEGGSPALSAEEKKEDIARKRTAALNSIDAAGDLANKTRAICEIDTDPKRDWISDIENTMRNISAAAIEAITHAYVNSYTGNAYDVMSSLEKGNVKKQFKEQQEESIRLRKQADAHIEKIKAGGTLPPRQIPVNGDDGCHLLDGDGYFIWRDEAPAETAARRKKFLKSWDALIEAVGKAYTDTKAVFDAVDAQNDGWTLIDILHG